MIENTTMKRNNTPFPLTVHRMAVPMPPQAPPEGVRERYQGGQTKINTKLNIKINI